MELLAAQSGAIRWQAGPCGPQAAAAAAATAAAATVAATARVSCQLARQLRQTMLPCYTSMSPVLTDQVVKS